MVDQQTVVGRCPVLFVQEEAGALVLLANLLSQVAMVAMERRLPFLGHL
jgi:hypothetical protein